MRLDFSSPKIARDLREQLESVEAEATLPVIIRYRDAASMRLPKAPGLQVTRMYRVLPGMAARLPAKQIHRLVADDAIEHLWHDFRVRATLDVATGGIGAPVAWEAGLTGKGVNIAIVDTGIDADHPDFGDRIVAATNCLKRQPEAGSSTWAPHDLSAADGNGHGTHVAGIAAGNGAASDGLYRGAAPEANLLVAKALDDDGAGDASDVIAALEWAYTKGAQVACLSLGGSEAGDGTDALSVACDEFVERGMVICVAAGNDGPRPYTVGAPGCARQVITVGAADLALEASAPASVASFSSRGPTSDRRTKPDVVCPGVGIASCRAAGARMGDPVEGHGGRYVRASGTSMAAPLAAGACALLLQAIGEATPNQVKQALCLSARGLGDEVNAQGAGLADVAAAVERLRQEWASAEGEPRPAGCLAKLVPWLGAARKRDERSPA